MSKIPPPPAPKKEVIAPLHESLTAELSDDSADIERNYGEARLWLAARDPRCLFAYWDFRPEEHPDAFREHGSARFFLRIFREGGAGESSTEVDQGAGNVFIPAQSPDCCYFAELGFFAGGTWCFLARSGTTRTPPELPGSDGPAVFATIPARLSLGKMRDLLATSALPSESLAMTAARIQNEARNHAEWTPEHERLLAEILGASASGLADSSATSFALTQTVRQKLAATAGVAAPGSTIPNSQIEAPSGASWPSSR
ncbi:MAG: DUF4912 domain-containing protein [Chthoniobacteraceae bacterium]